MPAQSVADLARSVLSARDAASPLPWRSVWQTHTPQTHLKYVAIDEEDQYTTLVLKPGDADYIAIACNAAPALASALLEAEERIAALREAALKLADLVDRCQLYGPADACRGAVKALRSAAGPRGGENQQQPEETT